MINLIKGFFRILMFLCGIILFSCEKKIDITINEGTELLVVEGHIEPGLPPYIILTKSQPYFSPVSFEDLRETFVHNALVKVSEGKDTVTLSEVSSDSIPEFILEIISERIGIKLSNQDGLKVYAYIPENSLMLGKEGGIYNLQITVDGNALNSITTIPRRPVLDSLWATPHPVNDSLVTLNVRYSDPPGEDNFIRYFTSTNSGPFYPPYFQSIFDDKSIFDVDGKTFDLPIQKGHNRNKGINFRTFTYFSRGDTVILRWCAIDRNHFDFWKTAEYDRASTGNPFSSPVRITSNINGGLGVWGGYNPLYYPIIIP